jgi:hypothetical protein
MTIEFQDSTNSNPTIYFLAEKLFTGLMRCSRSPSRKEFSKEF